MDREIIFFDLDRTLINTDQLVFDTRRALSEIGINLEEEAQLHEEYVKSLSYSTDFDPEEFINYLAEHLAGNFSPKDIRAAFYKPEEYELNVYPGVLPVLDQLSLEGEVLGIYSEGNEHWQQKKLQLSGLEKYFLKVNKLILKRKTEQASIERIPPSSWVIDDNLTVIESLLVSKHPVKPIWLNRLTAEIHQVIPTIFSLNSFLEILAKA